MLWMKPYCVTIQRKAIKPKFHDAQQIILAILNLRRPRDSAGFPDYKRKWRNCLT